jgi:uncharacterized spore protein YtfJ
MGDNGHDTEMIEHIAKEAGPKAVFGEPHMIGGKAVIPVSAVMYGGGAGSGGGTSPETGEGGQGEGYGFGVRAHPVGAIEVDEMGISWFPVIDYSRLAMIWSVVSGIALLMLMARLLFARRS